MELIFEHIWIVFIVIVIVNAFMLRWESKRYISDNPELKEGYRKFFKALLIYPTIPWLIMGIGDISGIPGFDFFGFSTTQPLVLLFHASWIAIIALAIRWIYFKNGADFLARHPGMLLRLGPGFSVSHEVSAKEIKLMLPRVAFSLIGLIVILRVI